MLKVKQWNEGSNYGRGRGLFLCGRWLKVQNWFQKICQRQPDFGHYEIDKKNMCSTLIWGCISSGSDNRCWRK
ncbi:unnamed protein product [Prunus brigantina]